MITITKELGKMECVYNEGYEQSIKDVTELLENCGFTESAEIVEIYCIGWKHDFQRND